MINLGKHKQKKRLTIGAFFVLIAVAYLSQQPQTGNQNRLNQLFDDKQSGEMVEFDARVVRILSDDNEGSRHQRFIVSHQDLTVLIAHNIDLAERVPLEKGDTVVIYGQYEWNDQGGVVHWTHADPQNTHADGWIKRQGKKYGSLSKY